MGDKLACAATREPFFSCASHREAATNQVAAPSAWRRSQHGPEHGDGIVPEPAGTGPLRRYLGRQQHIPLNRMSTISYGDTLPLGTNKTKAGRAKNRRVVVVVLE